jgi:hypothetical protein
VRFEERNPQQRNRRKLVALWSDVHGESLPNDAGPKWLRGDHLSGLDQLSMSCIDLFTKVEIEG